jgi:hypothetical protein
MAKRWISEMPTQCDVGKYILHTDHSLVGKPFVDGRVAGSSSWAIMCLDCHKKYGAGLGTGKGQKYNAEGEKVEG